MKKIKDCNSFLGFLRNLAILALILVVLRGIKFVCWDIPYQQGINDGNYWPHFFELDERDRANREAGMKEQMKRCELDHKLQRCK